MFQPAPGAPILERYELVRPISEGRKGAVWLARDESLSREVAAKIMSPEAADSPEALERFRREAMAVAKLSSSNAVQIYDYGIEEGCPVIVMERLQGEDLASLLERRGRLDVLQVARVVSGTARALAVAHEKGVIHRSLDPGAIFLSRAHNELIPKVLDFGMAKLTAGPQASAGTAVGRLLSSVHYASPEVAKGSVQIDHRTDLWSLGAIVYRAVTGRVPFDGANDGDVIVHICTAEPPPPSQLVADLPPDLDRFVERALAKSPDGRFQSARELALAFKRLAGHYSTTSAPGLDAGGLPAESAPVKVTAPADAGPNQHPTAAVAVARQPADADDDRSGVVRADGQADSAPSGIVASSLLDSLSSPSGAIPASLLDSTSTTSDGAPAADLDSRSPAQVVAPELQQSTAPYASVPNAEPVLPHPFQTELQPGRRRRGALAAVGVLTIVLVGGAALWALMAGEPGADGAREEPDRAAATTVEPVGTAEEPGTSSTTTVAATAAAATASAGPAGPKATTPTTGTAEGETETERKPARSDRSSTGKGRPRPTSQPVQPTPAPDDTSWMNSRF